MKTFVNHLLLAFLLVALFACAVLAGCGSSAEKENAGIARVNRNAVVSPPPEALEAAKGKPNQ